MTDAVNTIVITMDDTNRRIMQPQGVEQVLDKWLPSGEAVRLLQRKYRSIRRSSSR